LFPSRLDDVWRMSRGPAQSAGTRLHRPLDALVDRSFGRRAMPPK
jgi:hypothetical protein